MLSRYPLPWTSIQLQCGMPSRNAADAAAPSQTSGGGISVVKAAWSTAHPTCKQFSPNFLVCVCKMFQEFLKMLKNFSEVFWVFGGAFQNVKKFSASAAPSHTHGGGISAVNAVSGCFVKF